MNYALAGLIGLFGGLTSGMFGVGGGVVMVPAMIYLLRLTPHQAVATSLIVIVPTALVGALKHNHAGHVVWSAGLWLLPTALLGGYLGAWLTQFLSGQDLKRAFGCFLILVGLRLLLFK
ncbi:MAG: sulfite exporter TauE/SafE family protein [Verrucomicrobiae bacterium]|nr:sulfite exporter TauE/SafE family protein [Verrucomicrobiae bacterium]MDW7980097.1 sulfite exporter TauE/SafE family protein [Verrucomicrobiales bacterium]